MSDRLWHLYILRLENGNLYTGITTDVERRIAEHRAGKGAKYLRGKKSMELAYRCPVGDRPSALKLEAAVKRLPKQKKELLITGKLIIDKAVI